jgi:hypothetical protein
VHGAFLRVYTNENEIQGQGLIQKLCKSNKRVYRDVLIYRNDYQLSPLDIQFIDKVKQFKNN